MAGVSSAFFSVTSHVATFFAGGYQHHTLYVVAGARKTPTLENPDIFLDGILDVLNGFYRDISFDIAFLKLRRHQALCA